jgi:predicted transcriptional regulator
MRFADYLRQTGKSQDAVAEELGVTQGRVSQLVLGAKPSWPLTAKIQEWSAGAVTPNDWLASNEPASAGQ